MQFDTLPCGCKRRKQPSRKKGLMVFISKYEDLCEKHKKQMEEQQKQFELELQEIEKQKKIDNYIRQKAEQEMKEKGLI